MRRVLVSNMVSLDGFFAGPDGDIDWHVTDPEFDRYAVRLLNSVDTLLFGRVTYQLMASYWPTPAAAADDPVVAERMNNLPKIVFSRTLEKAEWENTRLVRDHAAEEIARLKQQPGKDMVIFGSGKLVSSLAPLGLIDEYRLIVNPVVLGNGQPLFKGLDHRLKLKLLNAETFGLGLVLLAYQAAQ